MKQLLLIALLLLCLTGKGQSYYHAFSVTIGTWNNYTNSWNSSDPSNVDLIFTVQSNVIMINNKAQTTLTLGGQPVVTEISNVKAYSWKAIDNNYKNCQFFEKFFSDGETYFTIMYEDLLFEYQVTLPSGLDKFGQ